MNPRNNHQGPSASAPANASTEAAVFQALESRVLMSGSVMEDAAALAETVTTKAVSAKAVSTRALSSKSALTLADRKQLLANWGGPNAAQLKSLLDAGNVKGFDNALLQYMVTRTNVKYFYDLDERGEYVNYLKNEFDGNRKGEIFKDDSRLREVKENADAILQHKFPKTATSTSYTQQLPENDIDWLKFTDGTRQFIHGLNRMFYWEDLATMHQLSLGTDGYNGKYVTELKLQLNDWAKQHTPLKNADTWDDRKPSVVEPRWWLLDAAIRPQTWTEAYFKVLGTKGWDATSNTLFLHRMFLHGDFLHKVTPLPLDQNQAATHAQGLLITAQLFPEFTKSADWNNKGRKLLASALGKQFYADGGHIEQSVTYQGSILHTLLERYELDRLNGISWSGKMFGKLKKGVESFYQLLNPTGDSPALADSYRRPQIGFFTEAAIILNNPKYPVSRPRLNNVWFLGADRLEEVDAIHAPTPPVLNNRGDSYAMPQSGYYVMRSEQSGSLEDDGRNTRQIIFDAGPTGGQSHGHYDLLNFEYFGYGRTLIADPGPLRYDKSADREYVISTPAHNTISIDGKNHAQLEGPTNKGFAVDGFDVEDGYAQVTAHHFGYKALAGAPAVGRSIWFDKDNVMIVADWGKSSSNHNYTVSFNLPTTKVSSIANNKIRTQFTTNGDEKSKVSTVGNVQITSLTPGATLKREQKFTSSQPPPDEKDAAIRFSASKKAGNVVFITLVQSYDGTSLGAGEEITAKFLQKPIFGRPLQIQLYKGGVAHGNPITIQPPTLNPPATASATAEPEAEVEAAAIAMSSPFSSVTIKSQSSEVLAGDEQVLA